MKRERSLRVFANQIAYFQNLCAPNERFSYLPAGASYNFGCERQLETLHYSMTQFHASRTRMRQTFIAFAIMQCALRPSLINFEI